MYPFNTWSTGTCDIICTQNFAEHKPTVQDGWYKEFNQQCHVWCKLKTKWVKIKTSNFLLQGGYYHRNLMVNTRFANSVNCHCSNFSNSCCQRMHQYDWHRFDKQTLTFLNSNHCLNTCNFALITYSTIVLLTRPWVTPALEHLVSLIRVIRLLVFLELNFEPWNLNKAGGFIAHIEAQQLDCVPHTAAKEQNRIIQLYMCKNILLIFQKQFTCM